MFFSLYYLDFVTSEVVNISLEHSLTISFPFLTREDKDLPELSSLGHFLKGSSATLGFNKVRDSCQIIQQYGHKQTVDGTDEPDEEVCLTKIKDAVEAVKVDFVDLEKELRVFFGADTVEEDDAEDEAEPEVPATTTAAATAA